MSLWTVCRDHREDQTLHHQLHQALHTSHLQHLLHRLIFVRLSLPWIFLSTLPSQKLLPPLLLSHTNPIPVLSTDILNPAALISIDVMLVSPNCPTMEKDDKLKIINIQYQLPGCDC